MELHGPIPYLLCEVNNSGFYKYVFVDLDVYNKYHHLKWELNKDGYARTKNPIRVEGENKRREILLHKLVNPGSTGKSVHHINGKWDCRRESLIVYDTWHDHVKAEHPENKRCRQQKKRDRILCVADLHPHCG